jgi:hypothetical protein
VTDGGGVADGQSEADSADATDAPAPTAPTVTSTMPAIGSIDVPLNGSISATFSEAMNPTTLSPTTFTVTSGTPAVAVTGELFYASSKAVFWPAAPLAGSTLYTATITTGATSVSGLPLATNYVWDFTTGTAVAAGVPVNLGTAGQYVILAESKISTVSPSIITGNLGLSPLAATYINGFSLTMDSTNVFSTSSQVIGNVYAADYAPPTPDNLTTAVGDMGTAFTDAAGRAPDVTELGAGNIGGMVLPAGVYSWGTGLLIPTNLTLTGSATDVWIFQIAQTLTVSDGVEIVLGGSALAKNVFWQVSGNAALGTTVQFQGVILCQTGISLNTGASVNGNLLAQTAVTLDTSVVTAP